MAILRKVLTFTWFCPLRVKLASVAEIIVFFVIGWTFCISPYGSRWLRHSHQVARFQAKINCSCISWVLNLWALLTYETGLLKWCRVFRLVFLPLGWSIILRILLRRRKLFRAILGRLIRMKSQIWRWRLHHTVIIFVVWFRSHYNV